MTIIDLKVHQVKQKYSQLGRQLVHDPRSRAFPTKTIVDKSTWVSKTIRIYDPSPNPNQCHSECTGVAKCSEFNALGNRVRGEILDMENAHRFYHDATRLDPFEGEWPPDDLGSSGLGAAKAAKILGFGGEYLHVFDGADEVVQLIVAGHVVNVGTWWYEEMFFPNALNVIEPVGSRVGGHQYVVHGYDLKKDQVIIRCWWGNFRDVRIKRAHLNDLLLDDGDAHVQERRALPAAS